MPEATTSTGGLALHAINLATLLIVAMWVVLIGLVVWAIAAGRRGAVAAGYRLQARLVEVPPRSTPPGPKPGP